MTSETLAGGRYRVRGLLGEGAQGVTYEAVEVATGRAVAIKRFDVRGARSWKDVELAERETRVLATMDHPLLPRYHEHFEEEGGLYLVMERVEGETLDALRKRQGALPEDEVRRFLACADRALTYLHGRGSPVVHRDIKPRNVIRRPDGSYVFVDFGAVSEMLLRRGGGSTVVGTMGYMAPEQFQGRALPSTDVYAVGATALAALTGVEPETLPHRGLRLDVAAALGNRVSPEMVGALQRMLEPDPDERAHSLAEALDGVRMGSIPPAATRPPAGRPVVPAPAAAPRGLTTSTEEDARVKSLRSLLWVLWGLGWPIVVPAFKRLGIPGVGVSLMFISLALLLIATWHKGALLRVALRRYLGAPEQAAPVRQRIEVREGASPQVRIHATDLRPEDAAGDTDVRTSARQAQRP